MRRPDPTNTVLPRWAMLLVSGLPAGGTTITFILGYLLGVRLKLFNLTLKDSFLVATIGLVLVFTVLALLIYNIALMRALRRAVR